jgi:phage shock protein E
MQGQYYYRFAFYLIIASLYACSHPTDYSLSPNIFVYNLQQQPGQLIDVRANAEWTKEHLPNSLNLAFDNPESFKRTINHLNRRNVYYLYCHDGLTSVEALQQMQKAGFTQVYYLQGGLHHLMQEGYSVAGF